MSEQKIFTVEELALCIKQTLGQIRNIKVEGEIGKVSTPRSGHTYFELKHPNAIINCASWASSNIQVKSGYVIVTIQKLDFYGPYGKCSAVVTAVEEHGEKVPELANKKALLLERLGNEGILQRERLPIPDVIEHLCIITSFGSAAAHDMNEGIHSRWPHLKTTWIDTQVQGQQAPESICQAFKKAQNICPDVIICGRGGGSEADLDAFNDEKTVLCFQNAKIPIISAVGHENDYCLSDHVADVRAKTPTAAIEIAIPKTYRERCEELEELSANLEFVIFKLFQSQEDQLQRISKGLRQPVDYLFDKLKNQLSEKTLHLDSRMQGFMRLQDQMLKSFDSTMNTKIVHIISKQSMKLEHLNDQLENLSHKNTLKRGFAVVSRTLEEDNGLNNKILKSTQGVSIGDELHVQLLTGKMLVTVKYVE